MHYLVLAAGMIRTNLRDTLFPEDSLVQFTFIFKTIIKRENLFCKIILQILLLLTADSSFSESSMDSTNKTVVIRNIIITGNKTTRPHIIKRELIFHEGDTLNKLTLDAALERSRENLMNIGLFHFVEMQIISDVGEFIDIHIHVTERWYIWPIPFFEVVDRNFNEWWEHRDFKRTNYGLYLSHDNFRGRDESLKLQLRLGYSQRLGLFYSIPYINKKQNTGLSVGAYYTRNHEIAYNTINNKLVYVKDPDKYMRNEYYGFARVTMRKGFNKYYSVFTDYRQNNIADTVIDLNKDYFVNHSLMQQQITLGWTYRNDQRDYQTYALRGDVFELEILKQGIGILKNEPKILSITSAYRKYWELSNRWHFASGIRGRLESKIDIPYFNQRALGYGAEFIRGYEYYVINGQNYFLLKSNLKFTVMPTKILMVPLINTPKFNRMPNTFFINAFFDAGYVDDRQFGKFNSLSNQWQYGYGAGLDYLTYYDIVFRVEYSINRMGERAFFLHFSAPI